MRVGFTGTQIGMSKKQKDKLYAYLFDSKPTEFHHGDCIGADAEATDLAIQLGISIHSHPCTITNKRAFKTYTVEYPEKNPLNRNKDIVNMSDILIVAPKSNTEELRSGTWSTKRFAERFKKPFIILER